MANLKCSSCYKKKKKHPPFFVLKQAVSGPIVGPSFIPSAVRSLSSSSSRGQRNWIFYREARNALEFLAGVFEHFAQAEGGRGDGVEGGR